MSDKYRNQGFVVNWKKLELGDINVYVVFNRVNRCYCLDDKPIRKHILVISGKGLDTTLDVSLMDALEND